MSFRGVQRPSADDDDDLLLELQDSFSLSFNPPAATAARSTTHATPDVAPFTPVKDKSDAAGPSKKPSLFAQRRAGQNFADDEARAEKDPTAKPQREITSADALLGKVLSDVTERNPDFTPQPTFPLPGTGFPDVVHRTERVRKAVRSGRATSSLNMIDVFGAYTGHGEEHDIHLQGLAKLQSMSGEEIAAAQEEIAAKLDPSLVEMLRARARRKYESAEQCTEPARPTSPGTEGFLTADKVQNQSTIETGRPQTVFLSQPDSGEGTAPWIPVDQLEYEKLKWTHPVEEMRCATTKDDSQRSRFDFQGKVVNQDVDIPAHRGLHHHGDEPHHPGYTLQELLHLCRSTVASQRAAGLRILGAILSNIYNEYYDLAFTTALMWQCLRENILLHIRIALDDTHETVLANALSALAAGLGCGTLVEESEESCWDQLLLTRFGYRAFGISLKQQEYFQVRSTGKGRTSADLENDGTLESVIVLLRHDSVLGLLSTNLLARFVYLLRSRRLPMEARSNALDIMLRICRHSRAAAISVVECDGLVQLVIDTFVRAPWPAVSLDQQLQQVKAVKLLRLFCQAGRDIADGLVNSGLSEELLKFIAMDPNDLKENARGLGWQVQEEVWHVFGILFTYSLFARAFDDCRRILFERACNLFKSRRPDAVNDSRGMRSARIAFLRMMLALAKTFGDMLDVGGQDDALRPFVDLLLEGPGFPEHEKERIQDFRTYGYFSAIFDVVAEYGRRLVASGTGDAHIFAHRIQKFFVIGLAAGHAPVNEWTADNWEDLTAQVSNSSRVGHFRFPQHFVGLQYPQRAKLARALLKVTFFCDTQSSYINLLCSYRGIFADWDQEARRYLARPETRRLLRSVVEAEGQPEHCDWIRCFAQGRAGLLWTFLFALDTLLDVSDLESPYDTMYRCALAIITLPILIPGDEYIAAKILNKYILHPRVQNELSSATVDAPSTELGRQRLQEMLDYDLYSTPSLFRSESLYGRTSRALDSLLWEGGSDTIAMPVRPDWMYSPFEHLWKESKQYGHLLADARSDGKGRDDADDVVGECLKLIERMEGTLKRAPWQPVSLPNSVKVARLMCIFLLPSSSQDEMFRQPEISTLLSTALRRYTADNDGWEQCDMEGACGDKAVFYQFYQELVSQFAAVSFGDRVFGRYLLLPLSMHYPSDYRRHFWEVLLDLLGTFQIEKSQVPAPHGLISYFQPPESDEATLMLYFRALAERRISAAGTPFLYELALHHLSTRLFIESEDTLMSLKALAKLVFNAEGEWVTDVMCWGSIAGDGNRIPVDDVEMEKRQLRKQRLLND